MYSPAPAIHANSLSGSIGDTLKNVNVQSATVAAIATLRQMSVGMRSWTDFANPMRFVKPGDDWAVRMRTNITYYKSNYVALLCITIVLCILSNPFLLFALVVLSVAWAWLLTRKDPAPITMAGKTLGPFEQKAALGGITCLSVLLTGLSTTIFWALGVSTVVVSAHAVMHSTETHEVTTEEFGSSFVPGQGPDML